MDNLELTATRVISGRYLLRLKIGTKFRSYLFVEPSYEVRAQAVELYHKTYARAVKNGVPTFEQSVNDLVDRKLWIKDKAGLHKDVLTNEEQVKRYEKEIELYKKKLYEVRHKKNEVLYVRANLQEIRQKLSDLLDIKKQNYDNTAEAMASSSKIRFMVGRNLFKANGRTRIWPRNTFWDDRTNLLELSISAYLKACPGESGIRKIARSEPFRSIWATREATGNLFGKPSISLSDGQKGLILWGKLYQNAREDSSHPEEFVFDDDDMFDGWLAIRQEESEKDGVDKLTSNENIKNSDMIFSVAKSEEEEGCGLTASEIMDLNSPQAKAKIEARFAQLAREGEVNEYGFQDKRHEVMIAKNKAMGGRT